MGRKLFLFPHFYLINLHEEEGYKDDPNGDGNDHTEEDSGTDGMTAGRSGTRGKYHGQHTEYEGQRGHQDRAEPGSGSGDGRLYGINAFIHLAASPISVTKPIWKYTSFSKPNTHTPR